MPRRWSPGLRAALLAALGVLLALAAPGRAWAQRTQLSVDAPAALAETAGRIRAMDQAALAGSLAAAGLPLPPRIDVTLIGRGDPRAARIPDWVVGLAAGTSNIVIFPHRIGPYPHDSLETVVRHEIVHLALNARAGGRPLPRWFHEGVATTVESGWGVREEARLLLAALDPPSVADIGRLFASDAYPDTTQAYLLSAALVDEIRRRHGRDVPGRIAAHIADGAPFDAAFRMATGESVDDAADRAWGAYRRVSRWFLVATDPSTVWTVILLLAGAAFVMQLRRRRERRRQWDLEEAALEQAAEEADDAPEDEDLPGQYWRH